MSIVLVKVYCADNCADVLEYKMPSIVIKV